MRNPPTAVGTGFRNFSPSFEALVSCIRTLDAGRTKSEARKFAQPGNLSAGPDLAFVFLSVIPEGDLLFACAAGTLSSRPERHGSIVTLSGEICYCSCPKSLANHNGVGLAFKARHLRQKIKRIRQLDADFSLGVPEQVAPLIAHTHRDPVAFELNPAALLRLVRDGGHAIF